MRSFSCRPIFLVFGCLLALGCGQESEIVAAQPTLPDTPDGTVSFVAKNLADNHAEVLWEALPESWRADINGLTTEFTAKMDPELYDRSMALGLNFVNVLESKKGIILESETVTSTGVDVAEIEARMTPTLEIVRTLLASEVSTLAGLAAIDWQQFLAGTVSQILAQANTIEAEEDDDPFLVLESLEVEVVERTDDTALLLITAGDEDPEEVSLTRVEDRWVPSEMAENWDAKVAEAHANLEQLTPERIQEMKGQAMFGLAMAEGFVNQLDMIETAEDFDSTVGPMLDGLLGNLGNFMPDAGEDESADDKPADDESADDEIGTTE